MSNNANLVLVSGGGKPPEVGFPVNDPAGRATLVGLNLDKATVRKMVEDYLRGIANERLEQMGGDKLVAQEIDRRVQVAVNNAQGKIESQITAMASRLMEQRVRDAVSAVPLKIIVTASGESK